MQEEKGERRGLLRHSRAMWKEKLQAPTLPQYCSEEQRKS
jgi:hypothetical protein